MTPTTHAPRHTVRGAALYGFTIAGVVFAALATVSLLIHPESLATWMDQPLWTLLPWLLAFITFAASLTGFAARSSVSNRWAFGFGGALAGYAAVVAGTVSHLVIGEMIARTPGGVGGFGIVVLGVLGFTLYGGPVWVGLLAAFVLPHSMRAKLRTTTEPRVTTSGLQRRAVAIALCVCGFFVAGGVTLAAYVGATYGTATYKCVVEGPRPTESPLAAVSEAAPITGQFTVWPLGRECTYERADGQGTVTADSGNWGGTAFAGAGALAGIAGAVMLTADTLRRRAEHTAPAR